MSMRTVATQAEFDQAIKPMADEPRDLVDCWPFLVCGLVVVVALVCASAWGLLP